MSADGGELLLTGPLLLLLLPDCTQIQAHIDSEFDRVIAEATTKTVAVEADTTSAPTAIPVTPAAGGGGEGSIGSTADDVETP